MELITGKQPSRYFAVLYGVPGIGKSTVCSGLDRSLFIDLENGLSQIDCTKTPQIKDYASLTEALKFAIETSDFDNIIIDSATELEDLFVEKILSESGGKKSLADFGYGAGYVLLESEWVRFLRAVKAIKGAKKNVILIAHSQVQRYEDPTSESFDRYTISAHKKALEKLIPAADAILFCRHQTVLANSSANPTKKKALGTGRRIVIANENPAVVAKNRFGLADELELSAEIFKGMEG